MMAEATHSSDKHSLVEEVFEGALYNCRFLALFAVLGSLVVAAILFLSVES